MTFFMNLSIQDELQLFAKKLHQHLTPSFLEKLARELAFVQRKRKFSGRDLATICVWISQRVASDSLVRLCSQLHALYKRKRSLQQSNFVFVYIEHEQFQYLSRYVKHGEYFETLRIWQNDVLHVYGPVL